MILKRINNFKNPNKFINKQKVLINPILKHISQITQTV